MTDQWYIKLYGGLFDKIPRETILPGQILISLIDKNERRHFRLFGSLTELYDFLERVDKNMHNFYEIILGEHYQKPHFDIDNIEYTGEPPKSNEELVEIVRYLDFKVRELQDEITQQLNILGINPDELRWYASYSQLKRSLHLVIPGYYFENNLEAKRFYHYLMSSFPEEYKVYIDPSVYSSLQNFRLLGSFKKPKPGQTPRVKRVIDKWSFFGEEITVPEPKTKYTRLSESLISYVTTETKPFPCFKSPELDKTPSFYENSESIPIDVFQRVQNAFFKRFDKADFEFNKIAGNIISFKRLRPSKCPICHVTHDSIWYFVTVFGKIDEWIAYLHCGRAKVHVSDSKKRSIELMRLMSTEKFEREKKRSEWQGPIRPEEVKLKSYSELLKRSLWNGGIH